MAEGVPAGALDGAQLETCGRQALDILTARLDDLSSAAAEKWTAVSLIGQQGPRDTVVYELELPSGTVRLARVPHQVYHHENERNYATMSTEIREVLDVLDADGNVIGLIDSDADSRVSHVIASVAAACEVRAAARRPAIIRDLSGL